MTKWDTSHSLLNNNIQGVAESHSIILQSEDIFLKDDGHYSVFGNPQIIARAVSLTAGWVLDPTINKELSQKKSQTLISLLNI